MDLLDALIDREVLTVRAGSQVTEPEKVGYRGVFALELREEVGGKTAQLRLNDCIRVVSDESRNSAVKLKGPQPACTIERMKAGLRNRRCVPDIMEYRCGYEGASVAFSGQERGES